MAKNTHLTLSDRIAIEVGLKEQKSFSAIAAELRKDPTTIRRMSATAASSVRSANWSGTFTKQNSPRKSMKRPAASPGRALL